MSLLNEMPWEEYTKALALSKSQCEQIARKANIKISFEGVQKPGELLLSTLNRKGCPLQICRELFATSNNVVNVYYKPYCKYAILIANNMYETLPKLVTPPTDCDTLGADLKSLGFIVLKILNTTSLRLKEILENILDSIPENSYYFIFYAGHGCELMNIKCMLGTDCPSDNVGWKDCVTENYVLSEVAKRKPELCVFILDMCRFNLDSENNPALYSSMPNLETYSIQRIYFVVYTTQACQAAYENVELELSHSVNGTYQLSDTEWLNALPRSSQYVDALHSRIRGNFDISTLLDKVHADVESTAIKQTPIKVQSGTAKRSLYDPAAGPVSHLVDKVVEICQKYEEHCYLL